MKWVIVSDSNIAAATRLFSSKFLACCVVMFNSRTGLDALHDSFEILAELVWSVCFFYFLYLLLGVLM
jgi:hypothetical protein